MKIAFITNVIDKDMTGVGVYSKALIEAFVKAFPNFRYYLISDKDHFPKDFRLINKAKLIIVKNKILTKKKSIWFNYLTLKLKRYDFDYIFNLSGTPHLIKFKQKEILVIHDLHPILHPRFTSLKTNIYNRLFFKSTLEHAYKIIVNSKQTENELIKYFFTKKKDIFKIFIPPLIKKKPFYKKTNNNFLKKITEKPFVLYIGSLDSRKNLQNLIRAFYHLKEANKLQLILVGKPGFKSEEISNLIVKKRMNNVLLTGYLSDYDKYFLLSKCKIFVYLSFYEGLGIPIYEAAYLRKPIISSNIPIVSEFFKNNVLTANPNNVNSINKLLSKTVLNNDYPKKWLDFCQKKALEMAKKSTIQNKMEQLRKFLA